MPASDALFSDLDAEFDATRRVLAAVPWDRADWAPHETSTPLGTLARHIATLPRFGVVALTTEGMDMAEARLPQLEIGSTDDLLAVWDETSGALRAALAEATDEHLAGPWAMSMKGRTLFTDPRAQVVRQWTLSHIAHHRGQMTVYFRLLGVPVPGIYGPSADDKAMMAGA